MRNQEYKSIPQRVVSRRVTGQGMTEYIIVVALVAIAAVAAVSFFGAAVKGQFVQLGGELLGEPDLSGMEAAADENSQGVAQGKNGSSGLGNYGNEAGVTTGD